MKRYIKILLCLGFGWFLLHTAYTIADGLTDDDTYADAGIILGTTVNEDGTLSDRLQKRLDRGIELYRDSLLGFIIVSGGLGKEGHYEGTAMAAYLIDHGIPPNKVVVDNAGNTTEATAENVKQMNLPLTSVTVISQYFHVTRTKLAFRHKGFTHVYGAHAKYVEWRDVYSVLREFPGYYSYLLRYWVYR